MACLASALTFEPGLRPEFGLGPPLGIIKQKSKIFGYLDNNQKSVAISRRYKLFNPRALLI